MEDKRITTVETRCSISSGQLGPTALYLYSQSPNLIISLKVKSYKYLQKTQPGFFLETKYQN